MVNFVHHDLLQDFVIAIEGIVQPEKPHIEGKIATSFADQNIELLGKIADESTGRASLRYVAEFKLTHPGSDTDVHFTSEIFNNDQKVGAAAEATYLASRDRRNKVANIRTEIDKIRKQLSIQVMKKLNKLY